MPSRVERDRIWQHRNADSESAREISVWFPSRRGGCGPDRSSSSSAHQRRVEHRASPAGPARSEQDQEVAVPAAALPSAVEALKEVGAIRDGRLLLAPTDPVSAVRATLARELRTAVNGAVGDHESAWTEAMSTLEMSVPWQQITPDDRTA